MRLAISATFALATALPGHAAANGRLAGPANLRFHPTDPDRALVGGTIGLLPTTDGGLTWRWVCENAIGYGGEYDPDYAFHPTRDELWATTFEGLRVSRDGGCTWASIGAPLDGGKWIGEVEIGPDGRVWAATSTGTSANDVYVSTDGEAFVSTGLVDRTGWWESIKHAHSDATGDTLYVSGYRSGPSEEGFLRRTSNGGGTWDVLPLTGIVFGMDPRMLVLAVSPVDADVVFLRVLNTQEPVGDAVYRSTNGGQNWTKVLQLNAPLRGFAVSADGQSVFVGTAKLCEDDELTTPDGGLVQKGCLHKSINGGASFAEAGYSPRMGPDNTPNTSNLLAFGLDGALYAGGSNGIDGWVLGKSTDGGDSFSKVFALPDIEGPQSCAAETAQAECAALIWPSLCVQNFICPSGAVDAAPPGAADAGGGGGGGGCCSVAPTRAAVGGSLLLALLVTWLAGRRRARRP